jgi:succinate dehydrogenase / fumarate reductase flavoprotein subunit
VKSFTKTCQVLIRVQPRTRKAARVADFLELGELFAKACIVMSLVAVTVKNTKRQMEKQDDENFAYSCMGVQGKPSDAVLHKEALVSIMLNW